MADLSKAISRTYVTLGYHSHLLVSFLLMVVTGTTADNYRANLLSTWIGIIRTLCRRIASIRKISASLEMPQIVQSHEPKATQLDVSVSCPSAVH